MINIFKSKKKCALNELIEFELVAGKVVNIKNHNSFQTRGESTIKMIMDSLIANPINFTGSFHIHTSDYPKEITQSQSFYYSCDSQEKLTNTIPDFVFDAWPQAGISSYSSVTQKISEKGKLPFQDPRLLWIGNSKTHNNREIFLHIAAENPSLIAAFDTCVDRFILHNEAVKYISLEDHTHYKYLIDLEGRGYSGRLKLLLFSKRLLFIQDRPWKEFYHFDLQPYVHYIPVQRDLSNLIEQINYVEEQGIEYYNTIVHNAYIYASEYLSYERAITKMSSILSQALSSK